MPFPGPILLLILTFLLYSSPACPPSLPRHNSSALKLPLLMRPLSSALLLIHCAFLLDPSSGSHTLHPLALSYVPSFRRCDRLKKLSCPFAPLLDSLDVPQGLAPLNPLEPQPAMPFAPEYHVLFCFWDSAPPPAHAILCLPNPILPYPYGSLAMS